ncbi:MAG: nitrous oxide reductase accessory protein NosL [Ignavibacteriales bacterium]|nr:nitrous oxide reductase accessory protein NosL [Ignavibacteriales bacterium]
MGDKVGRSTVFGLPLQQQWSYRVTGENAPTYYLDTDAPLYYYSFCDAWIAAQYLSLPKEKQEGLDPMIIGFNVTDMYAADHIKDAQQHFRSFHRYW